MDVYAYEYPYVHACGYVWIWFSRYESLWMYIKMHMSTCIIILMVVFIIYLFCTFVHGFVFKTYTPLSTF